MLSWNERGLDTTSIACVFMISNTVHILLMWFVQYLLISMSGRYSIFPGQLRPGNV